MLICLLTFPIISHNLAKKEKVVKDAIGCHLLLDTHLHRSVQGCCCIQGLLWRTRGNLLGCDYSLFYGIFPLPYCKVLLAKTRQLLSKLLVCCFVCMTLVAEHYESIRITCDQLRIMHRNNVHEKKKKNETSK